MGQVPLSLSDSVMKSKNKLFTQISSIVGIKQIHSSPYCPQGNGHIANVQNFLKMCMHKHVSMQVAWDEVSHIAYALYNFVSNACLKESSFFLMFGRDAYTPLVQLLHPKIRCMGDDKSFLALVLF